MSAVTNLFLAVETSLGLATLTRHAEAIGIIPSSDVKHKAVCALNTT